MFYVVKEHVYCDQELLKLFPALNPINGTQELECIVLALHPGGPYRTFSPEERWKKAKIKVFGDIDKDFSDDDKTLVAIELFKSFFYDERRDIIDNFKTKISRVNKELLDEKDSGKISAKIKTIEDLRRAIDSIQKEIDKEEEADLVGGGKLSYLEKFMENRRMKAKTDAHEKEQVKGIQYLR